MVLCAILVSMMLIGCAPASSNNLLVHGGFDAFNKGRFDNGGDNLYVNGKGVIETIHRWDVNHDGFTDLIFANSEEHGERGPTRVFTVDANRQQGWKYRDMSGESGYSSRIADLDADGYGDLVVANGDNGINSEINSFVYWGGHHNPGRERTELPTVGAYDVAIFDIDEDGDQDLIFSSSWQDRHNSAEPILAHVYLSTGNRQFQDASERYAITCMGTMGIVAEDLNADGLTDLVLANNRKGFSRDTASFIYWGHVGGFRVDDPVQLPTHGAQHVLVADLNQDGTADVTFSGGGEALIYWNRQGKFSVEDNLQLKPPEETGSGKREHLGSAVLTGRQLAHATAADLNRDGRQDLVLATVEGVEIRGDDSLEQVQTFLPLENLSRVTAGDLNGDAWPDLVVCRSNDGTTTEVDSVIFWNRQGKFALDATSWIPSANAEGNAIGDLNGDGVPEVVVNNCGSGRIAGVCSFVYLGDSAGMFHPQRRLELPRHEAYASCLVDLNLDGHTDVVLAGCDYFNTRIFYGSPEGPSAANFVDLENVNNAVTSMAVADINRDGYLDILTGGKVYDTTPESLAKSSTIFFGSREGFSSDRTQNISSYGFGVHLADLNRDGYLEAIFSDTRDYLLVYVGSPTGFAPSRTPRKIPCPIPGRLNTADLNGDDWLDLVVSQRSHRKRRSESFTIMYSRAGKFSLDNSQTFRRGITVLDTAVADFNRDGHLDVMASAYSSPTARVLPVTLHWGDGQRIDMDHPVELPASSSAGLTAIDFNRDGWLDIAIANHRDDASHKIDSYLYWNGRGGFDTTRLTRLPALGPHGMTCRDFGNGVTRRPEESYISPSLELTMGTPQRIHWDAEIPSATNLKFQLRCAPTEKELEEAPWTGPDGETSYYERSGRAVSAKTIGQAKWLQYKATFVSLYGCKSPKLREVRFSCSP